MRNPPPLRVIHGCKECSFYATRTEKTLNKKSELSNGSVVLSPLEASELTSSISIAKGTLAILLSGPTFRSTKPSREMTQAEAHSRILLEDLMEEVLKMETLITTLQGFLRGPLTKR